MQPARRLRALLCGAVLGAAGSALGTELHAEQPLSAIDWLSRSVSTPTAPPHRDDSPPAGIATEAAPASVAPMSITVGALDPVTESANRLGLVSAARSGLPPDFWGDTPEAMLATLLRKERYDALPAIQSFFLRILLAQLDLPKSPASEDRNVLFLARIDRLLDLGALDQAMALLEEADPDDPEIFRRRFDVALLLGRENAACDIMAKTPAVSPSLSARVFCLARRGDWQAASLTLSSGRAIGEIDPDMGALLERFLDPSLDDDSKTLPPPTRPSPLVFRLMEAIGQPLPTTILPVAFAQADLSGDSGWAAQLEAAERLTRSGVLDPNRLFGIYTRAKAAASGGIWDRVTIISALDRAIAANRSERVAQLLPGAWEEMQGQELEPALAAMFAARLRPEKLSGEAAHIAFRLALLTPDFEKAAERRTPADADEAFLIGLAKGDTSGIAAQDQMGLLLKRVFDAPPEGVPERYQGLIPNRQAEAVLMAIDDITEGARGDTRRVGWGLSLLRAQGFETVARRTAIELMTLERSG